MFENSEGMPQKIDKKYEGLSLSRTPSQPIRLRNLISNHRALPFHSTAALAQRAEELLGRNSRHSSASVKAASRRGSVTFSSPPQSPSKDAGNDNEEYQAKSNAKGDKYDKAFGKVATYIIVSAEGNCLRIACYVPGEEKEICFCEKI